MKPRKSCWTCAARRIRCDGNLPTCGKCAQSQLRCQGYESRLSWPREDDKRRAIVATPMTLPLDQLSERPITLFLINTTCKDMELDSGPPVRVSFAQALSNQPQLQADHADLLHHFRHSAHQSLVTFRVTTWQIRDALMRMAVAPDNFSGLALLHALLAYSSLHRHGLNKEAMHLKIQALRFLSASMKDGQTTSVRAAQHVAASMLLGAFENTLPSESSGEWLWHIWGAMDVVQAAQLKDSSSESDTSHLLDWVYYHEVYGWHIPKQPVLSTGEIQTGMDIQDILINSALLTLLAEPSISQPLICHIEPTFGGM
ncbi:hypothetical protein FDECE_13402 [Fusarium decemcellulare]|nr:hypothetical protein FDECE_13402 [Fusarium decemcellulare]